MFPLTSQVRLSFTGTDRVRYLNGQVTNDVRKLVPGVARWAGVCNHKGKLEALVTLRLGPEDSIYVDGPAELREFLPARLEKYLIADDAACEDVSETTVQAHFLEMPPPLPAEFQVVQCARFGVPGWEVWGPMERQDDLPAPTLSNDAVELLRIQHGLPAWENELSGDRLLPETGLEAWAVDYHKGCYIGQEVISRLKSVGRTNRHLAALVSVAGPPPEAGWVLFDSHEPAGEPKPCGELTSVAWHSELQKTLALGYVRREHLDSDACFLTGPRPDSLLSQIALRKT